MSGKSLWEVMMGWTLRVLGGLASAGLAGAPILFRSIALLTARVRSATDCRASLLRRIHD
jgi:hypothetical protein